MVAKSKKKTTNKIRKGTKNTPRRKVARAAPMFGAVSTINTAPVAIGNSVSGVKSQVIQTGNGSVRVIGRDYAFVGAPNGTYANWTCIGGVSITPAAFVSSVLRSYTQIYNKFKTHRINLHYITSSATSSAGDIMFSIGKNRTDPGANQTALTFLPYVLSDPNTVLGPQWMNHTCSFAPKGGWNTLDVGVNSDIDHASDGEIFLYSKTANSESPGYVLIDYDFSFAEMSVNPRAGALPNAGIVYSPTCLELEALAYTSGVTQLQFKTGTYWTGGSTCTALTSTAAFKVGDVYKVIFDMTASSPTWTSTVSNPNNTNLMGSNLDTFNQAITTNDGFTCYAVFYSSTNCVLYSNPASAFVGNVVGAFEAGSTYTAPASTATTGIHIFCVASWIGNANASNLQQV